MFRWISGNYRTFLWALALAIAVWVSAVTSADPDVTRTLPFSVPIQIIGQDPGLVINSEIPTTVEMILRAPRSVWSIIESDPQIVQAILDLSGLSSGEHSLDLQVQINTRPVQIVSVAPHNITFTLESLSTKTINISLNLSGETAVGYVTGDANLEPLKVVIAGSESQVEKVQQARVTVNVNNIRENFDQTLPIEILDDKDQKVEGVSVSPESIHVTLPVRQQGGYRDVAVKVIVEGRVASGYRLTDISVFPPIVTLFSADPKLVNDLPGVVETELLSLQNAQENINTRLTLNLPEGVSIVGEQTVLIQAGISPIQSSVTIGGEKVDIIGLSTGLSAQISPETVDVILSGPLPLLDKLTREGVRVIVDLTNLNSGTHQVTPKVEVLISDIVVESILPNTIEVIITQIGTPTKTPMP